MMERLFFHHQKKQYGKNLFSLDSGFLKFLLDLKINGINSKAKGNIKLTRKKENLKRKPWNKGII